MSAFACIMQYALLYYVAGLSVVRETIAAPVTSSALTGLMQNRVALILRYYIRAHMPQSVWGAREPSCSRQMCIRMSVETNKNGKVGHICDYAWRPFLDWLLRAAWTLVPTNRGKRCARFDFGSSGTSGSAA